MISTYKKLGFVALSAFLALELMGCRASATVRLGAPPLQTVQHVELSRYLGTWFEIASFPQSFQRGCWATTANYSLAKEGHIVVLNSCRKGDPETKYTVKTATGRARIVDTETNAKLKVSFFRPFWGDYWIIDLGENYEYAVVGSPSRDYLWILSRTPKMDRALYQAILARLQGMQYEIERLQLCSQPDPDQKFMLN